MLNEAKLEYPLQQLYQKKVPCKAIETAENKL